MKSYRTGLLSFCGEGVEVEFDPDGPSSKEGFRLYDDGHFRGKIIKSKHPNMLKGVIVGKKSWGLWLNEWTNGIAEGSFRKDDILDEFKDRGIEIPEPFLKDFNNRLIKKLLGK